MEYTPALVQTLSDKHRDILSGPPRSGSSAYVVFDPELGWTIRPNGAKRGYRANSVGHPGRPRVSRSRPPAGILRIAAFGDSFTHASDVPNAHTWHRRMEEMHPKLEVLNFGVPGFEPGQALLRYRREGIKFHPDIVLIGFMSENINRVVNTFRPFYFPKSGVPFAKPRFALRRGELVLVENPIRSLDGYRELIAPPGDRPAAHRPGRLLLPAQLPAQRLRLPPLGTIREHRLEPVPPPAHHPGRDLQFPLRGLPGHRRRPPAVLPRGPGERLRADPRDLPRAAGHPRSPRRQGGRLPAPSRRFSAGKGYRVIDLLEGFQLYDPQGEMMKKKFIHYPKSGNRIVARTSWITWRRTGWRRRKG